MKMIKTRVVLLAVVVLMLAGAAQAVIDPNLADQIVLEQHFNDPCTFDPSAPLDLDPNIVDDTANNGGKWIAGFKFPGAVATTAEYWDDPCFLDPCDPRPLVNQSMDTMRQIVDGYGTGQLVGYVDLGAAKKTVIVTFRFMRSHSGQEIWCSIGHLYGLDGLNCGVVARADNDLRVFQNTVTVPTSIMRVDDLYYTTMWDTSWHQVKVVIDLDGGSDADHAVYDVYYSQDGTGDDYVLAIAGLEFAKDAFGIINAVKFSAFSSGYPEWVDDVTMSVEEGGYEGPYVCGDPGTEYLVLDYNENCYVDLPDFAVFASGWLACTDPAESYCDQYWKD